MYRFAEERMNDWISHSKKALLIYGARQVGKTYLIRKMLRSHNISYFEVNLQEREDIVSMLREEKDISKISEMFALYSDVVLEDQNAIVFLDEIQLYPEIITKIKFLVDEGRFRYVLSGSNLGVELKGIKSIPVGYVDMWQMYPMNFEEFMIAMGVQKKTIDHLKLCYEKRMPVDELIHKRITGLFYYYLIVGGMPAAVQIFLEKRNLMLLDQEQKGILALYKADFVKYEAENRRLKIIAVFDNIPAQLNKQNHRFVFTMLNKELKFERYEESFLWLKDAAVALPVYISTEPVSPLVSSKETNVFKLFQSDVGLLTSCYPATVKKTLLEMNPDNEINNGALFENFVAQELSGNELTAYYYKTTKIGEVDFLVELDGAVIPVEVKSGKNYKKHAALNKLMKIENYHLSEAIVLSLHNVEVENHIVYLPIYMATFMKASPVQNIVVELDMAGL